MTSFRQIMSLWFVGVVSAYIGFAVLAINLCSPGKNPNSLAPNDPFLLGILLPMGAVFYGTIIWLLSLVFVAACNLVRRRNLIAMSRRSLLIAPAFIAIAVILGLLFGDPRYGCGAI